jgi:ABC-type glycerol-3-phosphate transport system permease component
MHDRRTFSVFNVLTSLLVIFVIGVNLLTLSWGVLASFKPPRELVVYPPHLFDFNATLENYRAVLDGGFMRAVANSAIYGLAAAAIVIVCGSMTAFGLGRFRFRGREPLFLVFVAGIPLAMGAAAMLIPTYLMFSAMGITNTWLTLPLIYAAHMLPLAVWIIRGSMDSIPYELDEAAYVDGASSVTVLWRIVLPLCKPALAAVCILVFIYAWNEFVAGSAMVDAKELKPIQPILYQFIGFFGRDWGPLTAAATIAMIPIGLLYAFFGRYLVSGLTHGATKG